MKIHWSNIVAFALAVLVVVMLLRHGTSVALFTSNVARIGPGHSADKQTLGLLALGIIGVSFVSIVRLLTRK